MLIKQYVLYSTFLLTQICNNDQNILKNIFLIGVLFTQTFVVLDLKISDKLFHKMSSHVYRLSLNIENDKFDCNTKVLFGINQSWPVYDCKLCDL
jgi:hypothetical protein